MSAEEKYDHGPLQTYEVIYTSGHIERVLAHQLIMPNDMPDIFGIQVRTRRVERWTFHGEFDGKWMLVLSVPETDVRSVRNVTKTADDLAGDR